MVVNVSTNHLFYKNCFSALGEEEVALEYVFFKYDYLESLSVKISSDEVVVT
jgi:hypothetical protein